MANGWPKVLVTTLRLKTTQKSAKTGRKRAENAADDVAGASEAAVDHLDALEDADDAQGLAQTRADVPDDVLEAGAVLLGLR